MNRLSNKVYGTHRHFSFLLESLLSLLFLLYFFKLVTVRLAHDFSVLFPLLLSFLIKQASQTIHSSRNRKGFYRVTKRYAAAGGAFGRRILVF